MAEKVIGGWGVDGNTTFQKGFPVNINASQNQYLSGFGVGTLRPNVVSGVKKATSGSADARAKGGWINPGAFSQPAPCTFGSESRVDSSLRATDATSWSLMKGLESEFNVCAIECFEMRLVNARQTGQSWLPPMRLPRLDEREHRT